MKDSRSYTSTFVSEGLALVRLSVIAALACAILLSGVAVAQDAGTPVVSEGCVAPELSSERFAEATSAPPDDAERTYEPAESTNEEDASAAIEALNHYTNCVNAGEHQRTLSFYTPYGLYWANTNAQNIADWNEHQQMRIDAGFALSPAFDAEAAVTVAAPEATPVSGGVQGPSHTTTYGVENAVQLDGGRIAVLHTVVLPAGSELEDEPLITEMGTTTVLANVDGEWLIDETLPLCFDNCEVNRAMLETALFIVPVSAPAATPES